MIKNNRIITISPIYCGTMQTRFMVTYQNSAVSAGNVGKVDSENTKNFLEPHEAKALMLELRSMIEMLVESFKAKGLVDDIVLEKGLYEES